MREFVEIKPLTGYVSDIWVKTCEERGWDWPIYHINHKCGHHKTYLANLKLRFKAKKLAKLTEEVCPSCSPKNSYCDSDYYNELSRQKHLEWIYSSKPIRKLRDDETKAWDIKF